MPTLFDERAEDDLARDLRRAVAAAEFDYPALVSGVHRRAGRLRRRQVIVTGATVAVLAPLVVGGGALALPGLLPSGIPTVTPPPAALDRTAAAAPATALAGPHPGDPDAAWEIPDARPTGVGALDDLGAPVLGTSSRRVVPVSGVTACDGGPAGGGVPDVEPLTGQVWRYAVGGPDGPSVDIQVTGWADSTQARDALRDDEMTSCFRDTDSGWQQLPWEGRAGDEDYLLYSAASDGLDHGVAVVRQGDYLVGVTVTDTDRAPVEVAAEVAARTAANLEALDPVHGRD